MNKALIPFIIVSSGEIVAVAFGIEILQWICKPLLMVTLGVYYYSRMGKVELVLVWPVIGAVLFSLGGDVALMFQSYSEVYFMAGLASFLVAHLCYLVAYRRHRDEAKEGGLSGIQRFRAAMPVVLAGTGLITILYPHLGPLKIPVTLYAIILIMMVLHALFRFGHTHQRSFWMVFIGAILFMISDAVIAINKFLSAFSAAGLVIMITYILAQFLIIRGLVAHADENQEK